MAAVVGRLVRSVGSGRAAWSAFPVRSSSSSPSSPSPSAASPSPDVELAGSAVSGATPRSLNGADPTPAADAAGGALEAKEDAGKTKAKKAKKKAPKPEGEDVLGESGNAYFHTDVYDDQERERRQFVLGLYELLKNDGVTLQSFARPWTAPPPTTILRFDSTHEVFAGSDATLPGAQKVRLTIALGALGLNPPALRKLKLLAGPRYNVSTNRLIMASADRPTRDENKAAIMTSLAKLVAASVYRPTNFATVPLLQARRDEERPKFPAQWRGLPRKATAPATPTTPAAKPKRAAGGASTSLSQAFLNALDDFTPPPAAPAPPASPAAGR